MPSDRRTSPQRRLAILTTHPVQYYAPLFRELAGRLDLEVFYALKASPEQQAAAGFGVAFDWDIDLLSGYRYRFLNNVAAVPSPSRLSGCDTPEIGERLAEGDFDAVLTLGWHVKSLLQGIWAAKRQGRPVLVRGDSHLMLQANPLKLAIKRLCYPRLLRTFDAALVVGSRNRAYYEHYAYPAERMFLSPHAIDTSYFAAQAKGRAGADLRRREGLADDARVVLFAGKLLDIKRPLDLVEAVSGICRQLPGTVLLIAGSGPLEKELHQRVTALGVPARFLGFVNQSRMPSVYAASDVLVLPSGRESWGLVANEALACGCPIVVSDAAGCASDLCDNVAGISYPCGDISRLRAALARMLSYPPAAGEIAHRSDAHSLKRAADGIQSALDAVSERRNA